VLIVACQSSVLASTATEVFSSIEKSTFTMTLLPTSTPTQMPAVLITPIITATPFNAIINADADVDQLIGKIFPGLCIGFNFAEFPSVDLQPSKLEFIEADVQPDPKLYWVSEIADSADKSRQAFVACKPEFCQDKIYVKNANTGKVFEINWDARMPWRPIQWITWINSDILTFFQSSNPDHGLIIAVNVDKREVLYESVVFPDYVCSTSTLTP